MGIKEILINNWAETEIEKEDLAEILNKLSITEIARLTNIINRSVTIYGQGILTQLEEVEKEGK